MVDHSPIHPSPPRTGRIDIHCHLLPGVDDGCQTLEETLESIDRLRAAGYVGSICTPHVWPDMLPDNKPSLIRMRVDELRDEVARAGVDYQLWAGGEVQLFEGMIQWMQSFGVPVLADSRCVLVDYWGERWPDWGDDVFRWLLQRRYQPILAHPERMVCDRDMEGLLSRLREMGVWLQGNLRCMTGEDGYRPDQFVRTLLAEDAYRFMALDAHGPDSLPSRLDGLALVAQEYGQDTADRLTIDAPRRDIVPAAG